MIGNLLKLIIIIHSNKAFHENWIGKYSNDIVQYKIILDLESKTSSSWSVNSNSSNNNSNSF